MWYHYDSCLLRFHGCERILKQRVLLFTRQETLTCMESNHSITIILDKKPRITSDFFLCFKCSMRDLSSEK